MSVALAGDRCEDHVAALGVVGHDASGTPDERLVTDGQKLLSDHVKGISLAFAYMHRELKIFQCDRVTVVERLANDDGYRVDEKKIQNG